MKSYELKSALDAHAKFGEQIAALETLQEKSASKLTALESNGNLEDQGTLEKISTLRVQVDLIPARIAVQEQCQAASLTQLLESTEEFVEKTLRPKLATLRAAAEEKVKSSLESICSGQKLINAINQSDLVSSINQISFSLQRDGDPSAPQLYVARRLAVLDQILKIEKSI
jgi:hypothetical protein